MSNESALSRYYEEYPKSGTRCFEHGADHRSYGWSRQTDPRWGFENVLAYHRGYEGSQPYIPVERQLEQ